MGWLRRWPLALALCAGAALAFAAGLLWPARGCLAALAPTRLQDLVPVVLAMGAPLGLGVLAGARPPRWVLGTVLLLAGAFASALSVPAFVAGAAGTALLALVAAARQARGAAPFALAAAALVALGVRWAAQSVDGCRAMSAAVTALPVLDVRCGVTAATAPPPGPGAPALAPEVQVRCRDGRAELTVTSPFPATPGWLRLWSYDRERGGWRLAD